MIGYLARNVTVDGVTYTPGRVDLKAYPDLRSECFTQDDVDIVTQCAAYFIAKDGNVGPDSDWLAGLATRIASLLPPVEHGGAGYAGPFG